MVLIDSYLGQQNLSDRMINSDQSAKIDSEHDNMDNIRNRELIWDARSHPDDLILPDAHPTKFPGKWVAIFEESVPMDQVNALRLEGFSLYKHIVALPDAKMQAIIQEDPHPSRDGDLHHEETEKRYEEYEHTYKLVDSLPFDD